MPHSHNAIPAKNELVRAEITHFLKHAPPPVRAVLLALLPAAKWAIDSGYHHRAADDTALTNWNSLLTFLSSIAAMQGDVSDSSEFAGFLQRFANHLLSSSATMESDWAMLLQVSHDLLIIGGRMESPEEVLRQSAEVLVQALRADLYLCRMRDAEGGWIAQFCDAPGENSVPMIQRVMDEDFSQHPVFEAIMHGDASFVVSNDLQAVEQGGESLDGVMYDSGYRSRLAFILRVGGHLPPFGLIFLYTRQEYGFDDYEERFLSKFASIVSLTVGRRIDVARDALEKASGAMAHFGNNALNVIRNQAEFCGELMVDIEARLRYAQDLSGGMLQRLPADSPGRAEAQELVAILQRSANLSQLSDQIDGVLKGVSRMTQLIEALKKSVVEPRLMHYLQGEKVLKLEE
ncbi:MAG: hypothetical protein LBH14_02050 [Desulfobulbaceae bacterium]|jgi:hypothetical protein|nr:hypothetical protein [Desulfobulbaceae bacterium]